MKTMKFFKIIFPFCAITFVLIISLFGLSKPNKAYAEINKYGWTRTFGGTTDDYGRDVVNDKNGNVYTTGYFAGSNVEFNTTGSGTSDLKSSNGLRDIYLIKYSSDGSYGWSRTIGGTANDEGIGLAADSTGNIYLIGIFGSSNVQFNTTGSGSSDILSTSGGADIFISKYNSNGSYGWTRKIGGTGAEGLYGGVVLDSNDNLYLAGYFSGTVEFNTTGSGSSDIKISKGNYDGFITKYDSNSNYVWTRTIGGSSSDNINEVAVDSNNNVYFGGFFMSSGSIEFNTTGSGPSDVYSRVGLADMFLTKYNSDGSYGWTRKINGGPSGGAMVFEITNDYENGVYLTGYFSGTNIEFNVSGSGTSDKHSSLGSANLFLTKYNDDGTYAWTRSIPSTSFDQAFGIIVDKNNNVYFTGFFAGTNVEFNTTQIGDPDIHSTLGGNDLFLTKYKTDGSYDWTKTIGGIGTTDLGRSLDTDYNNNLYIVGRFSSSNINFNLVDPSFPDLHSSNGPTDAFLTKINVLYQIENLPSNLEAFDINGDSIETGTSNGLNGEHDVYIKDSDGKQIAKVPVDIGSDLDWSQIEGETERIMGKAYTEGIADAEGALGTYSLYIPIRDSENTKGVRICPSASTLEDVTVNCAGGVDFLENETKTVGTDSVTVSKTQVDGQDYWLADGVSGTGGIDLQNILYTVTIDDNSELTNSRDVNVKIDIESNPLYIVEKIICDDLDLNDCEWEDYSENEIFTLSAIEGLKTIYVKLKDDSGNISEVKSGQITLDRTSPTISIETGSEYSSTKEINISLRGEDSLSGLDKMQVCESSEFTGCEWEAYSATKTLTLSTGDGVKTIYAKVKDKVGNISETEQDTIILDTVNNKPVITQLGLIKNITDKDSLYYHFNANKVRIYGTAESNSTVQFERSNGTKYTTQADAEGKFFILIDLPNGETKLTYSSTDLAGNVSGSRIITLNIDPYYVTSTEETTQETVAPDEEEVAEEITTPTEQEDEAVKPAVKSLLVVDSSGNILTNKTIEVEGKKYTTDEKGYIHTDTQFSEEMIASIEGRKYTIDSANTYLTLTEADESNKKFNYLYLIIPIIVVILSIAVFLIRKRNKLR